MMLLRGKGQALEIGCSEHDVETICTDLRARLAQQPDFYRGSHAKAIFGSLVPSGDELEQLRDLLAEYEIVLDGVLGEDAVGVVAARSGLGYFGPAPVLADAPSTKRPARQVRLSESARSLDPDFAGARSDLAARRIARQQQRPAAVSFAAVAAVAVEMAPGAERTALGTSTLYHRGTLRGGQALHNLGNIVVLGDVNPGAELVASGDIIVFGALRGVAHAGAQGDASARVVALDLAPTQLRIATLIAADGEDVRTATSCAEHAVIEDGRIVIVPHASAELVRREVVR
jgi:septum site-determining protein MinC